MGPNELFKEYAQYFADSLQDPVIFARNFLDFNAFPYQEQFLRDESNLIAACCGRQVGKTTLAAIKALHFTLANQSVRTLIISAGLRQSMILFDKIFGKAENSIPVSTLMTYQSRTRLSFANGSEIVALPCGRDGYTLRGFTCDMVILDECNFIPRVVIDSVIRPMTITRPKAKLIMISTPWMRDHPFYEAISKPELGFKTYTWPSSMNPLITAEKLDQERKTIGEYDFNREYNAAFLDDVFSYLPSSLVLGCTDDYPLHGDPAPSQKYKGRYVVGVDFGKHADHTVVTVLHQNEKGELKLVYLKEFSLGIPYTAVIGSLRRLNEAYSFEAGCLDKTGVGEGPYEEIAQFMRVMEGVTLTAHAKEDVLGRLKLTMERGKLVLPRDCSGLLIQMTAQRCEPTTSGTLKFSHPPGTHDDQLWSLALSVYASHQPTRPTFKPVTRSF